MKTANAFRHAADVVSLTIARRHSLRPGGWLTAWLLSGAIVLGLAPGCAGQVRVPRATDVISAIDWPERITSGLDQIAANTSGVLLDDESTGLQQGAARNADAAPPNVTRVVRCEVHGLGIVLELESDSRADRARAVRETKLAFVSFSPLTRDGERLAPAQVQLPGRIGLREVRDGVQWMLYETGDAHPCGLVVHLGGNKYVRRALLKQGWAVLSSTGTGRYSQLRASPQVFEIGSEADLGDLAARVARVFDDELADWPYSLEAVLDYLRQHRPDIPQKPLAVMGFSIGALGLPAVVARMPDRIQAAVIVAGGANLLEISQRSTKANAGVELKWDRRKPTREDWQALDAAYLESVKLDPYQAAAALKGLPVLVIHAHYDQVVPAVTGDVLYARLGKPERLVFPVGHRQLLRIVMRLQAGRIVAWMEKAVADRPDKR